MMRPKHRYILVESTVENSQAKASLPRALLAELGTVQYARATPRILEIQGRIVVRCSLEGFDSMMVALSLIRELDRKKAAFYTLKASGTIKALMSSVS